MLLEEIEVFSRESTKDPARKFSVDIIPEISAVDSPIDSIASMDATDEDEHVVVDATASRHNSDLSRTDRTIWVVTTAALPWRTGTAVNPLLRALYLTRGRPKHAVTLLVPWIADRKAREILYGAEGPFECQDEQEAWIREFCRTRASCAIEEDLLQIKFWEGVYHHSFGSIFPTIDVCSLIPPEQADVAILEEPEHLNWFRVPPNDDSPDTLGWAQKFNHVVGILHTNYGSYIQTYGMGTSILTARALDALSTLVVKAYCHKVIRLSDTLTSLAPKKEVTSNVHGVRDEFFGQPQLLHGELETCAAVYFIGKLIWAKGFEQVLHLQERYRARHGEYFRMDIYGGGNDVQAIQRAFYGRAAQRRDTDDSSERLLAAEIFDRDESLRAMLQQHEAPAEPQSAEPVVDSEVVVDSEQEFVEKASLKCAVPLSVLKDLSKRTLGTGVETAGAALQLVESALQHGFGAFSKKEEQDTMSDDKTLGTSETTEKTSKKPKKPHFHIGLAAYKWRRTPLPARFLGSKDHIEIKDIPQNVFLNMSTSEVLCTTSAEALAMGKFVILPKHSSNDFFLQFSNCLAYTDLDDCVDKLRYALANKPKPLTKEDRHKLSWEGAIERLYKAAGISQERDAEIRETNQEEKDLKKARFHVDTARKSQYVSSLFNGLTHK
jgi:hypothetical protein